MARMLLGDQQRAALRDLKTLAVARARAETEVEASFKARTDATNREFQEAQRALEAAFTTAQTAAQQEYQTATQAVNDRYAADHGACSAEFAATRQQIADRFQADKEKNESDFKEARWTIKAVLEADLKVAQDRQTDTERLTAAALEKVEKAAAAAAALLKAWRLADLEEEVEEVEQAAPDDPVAALEECVETAEEHLEELQSLRLPALLASQRLNVLFGLGWLVLAAPAALFSAWYLWLAAVTVLVPLAALGVRAWLKPAARREVLQRYQPLHQAVAMAPPLRSQALKEGAAVHREARAAAKARHDQALEEAGTRGKARAQELRERRDRALHQADKKYPPLLEELTRRRDRDLRPIEEKWQRLQREATSKRDAAALQAADRHGRLQKDSAHRHESDWQLLIATWKKGIAHFLRVNQEIGEECQRLFPAWTSPAWEHWQPPTAVPLGIRFGEVGVGLERIPHGVPRDGRLRPIGFAELALPALLPFPDRGGLLLKARDEGRAAAVRVLQAVMLRCLTSVPPGKVRFTIIDPVGLGENFAAFTHLADYLEALVTSRIWTEVGDIEQRLADVTAHLETVIQQFLRNQFDTLAEYNEQAGEVAEPYRVVVVANFPVNFSPEAARRLVSIATSGARCGVQTLISVDLTQPLPEGFNLADLEQAGAVLVWKGDRFVGTDKDYEGFPMLVDGPAADAFATRILQKVGAAAKRASRVEVPFDLLAPAPEEVWTADSRDGLTVPLGRAGATKKQYLRLGHGTSQHVLVAGKTGSGKSTLLHALICEIALLYSPDEVELYLVDFKKGVEFKTYAVHTLPHARVVAVESEREFGLSVLQRLDGELKERGERFRALAAGDLASYRNAVVARSPDRATAPTAVVARSPDRATASTEGLHPQGRPSVSGVAWSGDQATTSAVSVVAWSGDQATTSRLPRVVLIVDEFQEFFVEDDKIAQEAALLLDRLVRQGRAFGIHLVLGSQTLGGAYSLARSTIDQMAVRIALQCSEADGHLILSKDNGAARRLSRPGEAIYNDANGRVEGNDLFQTVWLSDQRREEVLCQVRERARRQGWVPATPQIIFEGTAPAELSANALLRRLVEAPAWPAAPGVLHAWLGEPVAIKEPTAAVFRRQSGANLLLVGQHAEGAANLMAAALVSLAAHQPLVEAPANGGVLGLYVLGAGDDAADGALSRLAVKLAVPVQLVGVRELPATLAELAAEVDRRQKAGDTDAPPRFLFVYGLHRFRDLRRGEDDFGFARRGEEKVSPAKQFATLLREGPAVGVHTVAWCDTVNNLNRTVDRQGMREFEMRVLFQMSAADSSNLIDAPLASKLGLHRALLYTEDQARLEKFRPYGPPDEAWLESVRRQLAPPPAVQTG